MDTAFIPAHPGVAGLRLGFSRAQPATTTRRARATVCARSLESYRDGRRFDPDSGRRGRPGRSGRGRSDEAGGYAVRQDGEIEGFGAVEGAAPVPQETRTPNAPKQHTTLQRALVMLNVASSETCAFLIRQKCVCVNGAVVEDERFRVHRGDDEISVNGRVVGTVQAPSADGGVDAREQRLPRSQRDRGVEDDGFAQRGYKRKVDGGFYSSRRGRSGK